MTDKTKEQIIAESAIGSLSGRDFGIIYAALRHLAASLNHLSDNVLERETHPLELEIENLGKRINYMMQSLAGDTGTGTSGSLH